MQRNQLTQSLWLLLLIIGCLLLASFLPSFTIGSLSFRKVNLLADIYPDTEIKTIPETLAVKDSVRDSTRVGKLSVKEVSQTITCPEGITCLEDFSLNKNGMNNFFKALSKVKTKPIRIAFYGDSFIEGDIITSNFRDTLQNIYGGQGVGYVPIATEVSQFRTTIQHTFSNWTTYSLVAKTIGNPPLGISGYAFAPRENNEVKYKPGRKQALRRFENIRIFYQNKGASHMNYLINDTLQYSLTLKVSDSLEQAMIEENNMQSVKLHFTNPDSVLVYGVSFESGPGIYVDNFAMRGNSGMTLSALSSDLLKQFNQYQDYKLILLQYGLNIITETDSMDYVWYQTKMTTVINKLKQLFPTASIVLIGISDRGGNIDGKIQTIPAVPRMRDAQREIARKTKIVFWDLYTAMGGENTMVEFVAATPPLGAKDYTHLNFRGGAKVAKQLSAAILHERNRYDKKPILP